MEFWSSNNSSQTLSSTMSRNVHVVANRHHVFEKSINEMQHQQTNQDLHHHHVLPQLTSTTTILQSQDLYNLHDFHLNFSSYSLLPQTTTPSAITSNNNRLISLSESESSSSSLSSLSSSGNLSSSSPLRQASISENSYWSSDVSATGQQSQLKNETAKTFSKHQQRLAKISSSTNRRHRRRHNHHHRNNHHQHPHQRHAANLRERKRMQSINDAFEGLRARIPTLPYEKRLSKVDTLRLAIGYIRFLADLVRTGGIQSASTSSSNTATSINGSVASAFHNRYGRHHHQHCCSIPAKKILLKSHLIDLNGNPNDPNQNEQTAMIHSLSWESDENKKPGSLRHGNILIAKVWTPEDPRDPQQTTNQNHNYHRDEVQIQQMETEQDHHQQHNQASNQYSIS